MSDARFEDGGEAPLNLRAETPDDLPVIAALIQDAVLGVADIDWSPRRRQLSFLINRFRWEDRAAAEREKRPYERVRALLVLSDVTHVASSGFDRSDRDLVLSLLDIGWIAGPDGTGRLMLTLSGDGEIRAEAECLSVDLRDVSRPYRAVSGAVPHHPE